MKIHPPILIVLLIALSGIAVFNWSSHRDMNRALDAQKWVSQTHRTIDYLDEIGILVNRNESAMRGYAFTENKAFIINYNNTSDTINRDIDSLYVTFRDNPQQAARLDTLSTYLHRKRDFELQLYAAAGISSDSARKVISGIEAKSIVTKFSATLRTLRAAEEKLLVDRTQSSLDSASTSFKTIAFTTVGSLVFVFVILLRLNRDIVLRRKTQRKLIESEKRYRQFVENAGMVSFTTDEQGYFTFTSNQAEALTGYTAEELKGKHFTELIRPDMVAMVVEHYTKQRTELIHETSLVFPIVHKNGQKKWVEQDTILLHKKGKVLGYQSVVKDVTEKIEMDRRICEMEREQKAYQIKIQAILDNTPLAIYVKDMEGRYILINKTFKENFNVREEDVIGKTMYTLSSKGPIEKYRELDEQVIATGKPVEMEDVLVLPDGEHHILTIKFPLFDQSNKLFGISAFMKDITDMVRYRNELIGARQRAELAESLQEQFLANMSHEIRTPMNGIIGMTNLLQKTNLQEQQRHYVQIIKQSSDNLLVLINDILDLSKIKAGKISIEKIPFNLQGSLDALTAGFKLKAEEKGIGFSYVVHPDVPEALKGDPYRLNQILSNLMSNAMKFTDKGFVSLEIKKQQTCDNIVHLSFNVTDTGIGIDEKNIEYIFESFAQESVSTTRKYGGTGLGLTITRRLVEMQNGKIDICSELGSGTTFTVTLPFIVSSVEEVNESIMPVIKPVLEGYDFSDKNVLIVEDNEINRIVLQSSLKQYNLNVAMAQNGLEAVTYLKENANVDLVLMDLHMPEMDGYEATKHIRHTLNLQVPIVILTASALRNEKQKSVELGANDYLTKPFAPEQLRACLEQYLGVQATIIDTKEKVPVKNEAPGYDVSGLLQMADTGVIKTIHAMFEKVIPEGLDELKASAMRKDWEKVKFISHKLKGSLGVIRIHSVLKNMSTVEVLAKEGRELDTILPMVDTSITDYKVISPLIREHLEKEVFNSKN
jgi:PAS domain S-box-containing protein